MTSVFLRAIKKDLREDYNTMRTLPSKLEKHAPATYERFAQCKNLYHGTSTDRFSKPKIGDIIKVQQELYTTHDKGLARGYADKYQPSAFRPDSWMHHIDGVTSPEIASSRPLLLRFGTKSPDDCDKYVKDKIQIFPHGVELEVLEVESDES